MHRHPLPSYQQPAWLLSLAVMMIMAISGCVMPPPPPVQDESLVTGVPCSPPCWYGIHPGQTAVEEAIKIVRGLPFVVSDSLKRAKEGLPSGFDEGVTWKYIGGTHPAHGGALYARQGTIVWMRVSLPRGLRLADVLVTQGEPDLVAVSLGMIGIGPLAEGHGYYLHLFYSERGVMLSSKGYGLGEGQYVTLSPDIVIDEAEYFAPRDLVSYVVQILGATEESARKYAQRYHPWPGLDQEIPVPRY